MRVRYTKARSFGAVGAQGLVTRAFEVGDEVDLPDMHAQVEISLGVAEAISGPTDLVHTPADVFPALSEAAAETDGDVETEGVTDAEPDGDVETQGDTDGEVETGDDSEAEREDGPEPEAKPARRSRASKA